MGAPDFRHVLRFEPAMPREHLHVPWQLTLFSLASAGRCSTIVQRARDLMMPLAYAPTTLHAENGLSLKLFSCGVLHWDAHLGP